LGDVDNSTEPCAALRRTALVFPSESPAEDGGSSYIVAGTFILRIVYFNEEKISNKELIL
jgi:hypothetical protein